MSSRIAFLTVAFHAGLASAAQADPFFPPGADAALQNAIAEKVQSLSLPKEGEEETVKRMVESAKKELAANLAKESAREELAMAVASAAETAVKRYVYLGGCPRVLGGLSEDEVLKRGVNLPCAAPCDQNLSACPEGWQEQSGLCVAGGEYDGLCSPVMDFRKAGDAKKASWAARCSAKFSCASV
eukprot:TRINITY_DN80186_c0_g1_i1.p1 TRINITY_DN80186_c0_g1~~TRINITY_DN80186_c0_g1_i1.p1  ORF type:complete len:207 (-),score=48.87 TRINITY_DN80186_c0_g1_i1:92-646(-)